MLERVIQAVKEKKTAIVSVVGILGLISSVVAFDDRYAKAEDLEQQQIQTQEIADMMKIQVQTEKTILEMKKAQGTLTPEEQVRLDSYKEILEKH